jgi:hypothetical protein
MVTVRSNEFAQKFRSDKELGWEENFHQIFLRGRFYTLTQANVNVLLKLPDRHVNDRAIGINDENCDISC